MAKTTLSELLGKDPGTHRVSAIKLLRDTGEEIAAQMAKARHGRSVPTYDQSGARSFNLNALSGMQSVSRNTTQSVLDADTVLQLLPDLELTKQILISSVLAPKDMMDTELTFHAPDAIKSPDVSKKLIAVVAEYFERDYTIKPLLESMLTDIMFRTGSYAVAVIPENSLDDLINRDDKITLESLEILVSPNGAIKNKGLLGPAKEQGTQATGLRFSMEGLRGKHSAGMGDPRLLAGQGNDQIDFGKIRMCDNPAVLSVNAVKERIREQQILESVGITALERLQQLSVAANVAMETTIGTVEKHPTEQEVMSRLYRDRPYRYKPINSLKTQAQLARRSVGNPLILHLPSESVIPVHVPGSPEKQVGFFVLIDADGFPLSLNSRSNIHSQFGYRLQGMGQNFPSAMLERASVLSGSKDYSLTDEVYQRAMREAYAEMVQGEWLTRLANGPLGRGWELGKNQDMYDIMFARTLEGEHTQVLFLPAELCTYMAFKYNDQGIGQSMLDSLKVVTSLRAMVQFADVMAQLKNSIGRTHIDMKLDEDDPDPNKSIEMFLHNVQRSTQQRFPLGISSPVSLVDYLERASYEVSFSGHPGLPDVQATFSEKNSNYATPDQTLQDNLRKQSIRGLGVPAEIVEQAQGPEFATVAANNHIMLARQVKQHQDRFLPMLWDLMRKVAINSEKLLHELRSVLTDNFDRIKLQFEGDDKRYQTEAGQRLLVEQLLIEFVLNFTATLPQPNTVTLKNQIEAMEEYEKAIDKGLEYTMSGDFYDSSMGGEAANNIETVKKVIKAYYMRKWMAENGMLPELGDLTTAGEDGNPMMDFVKMQEDHVNALTRSIGKLMRHIKPVINASDEAMQASGVEAGSTPSDTGDDSGDSGDDGDGGFDLGDGSGGDNPFSDGGSSDAGSGEGESGNAEDTVGTGDGDSAAAGNAEVPAE